MTKTQIFILTLNFFLLLITRLYGHTNTWILGISELGYNDKISSSIANSIKRSSMLILSKEFKIVDVKDIVKDRIKALNTGIRNKVDFMIFGNIFKKGETYVLVLQLIDILKEEVKISKLYEFEYDTQNIFEVIDNVVSDFKEGVREVIPKYEEEIAVEYRKLIETRETTVKIPGIFLLGLGLNLFSSISSEADFKNASLLLSFSYFSESGGIFGKGWFAGIIIPDILSSVTLVQNVNTLPHSGKENLGKYLPIYIGTKILNFFGIGTNFRLLEVTSGLNSGYLYSYSLGYSISPVINLKLGNLRINIFSPYFTLQKLSDNQEINDYFGSEGHILYDINNNFGISCFIRYNYISITKYSPQPHKIEGSSFNISFGVYKKFEI